MERISISLMNRVLDFSVCKRDTPSYKVESAMEIWWIGSTQVPLEIHETLKWLFSHSNIPTIIENQNLGESLDVDGVGSFTVEWHLSVNLKALKAMFRICGGANTKYTCLYCMASMGRYSCTLETNIGKQPSRNMVDLTKFSRSKKI